MKLPSYTLRDMFWAMTLIGIGLGTIVANSRAMYAPILHLTSTGTVWVAHCCAWSISDVIFIAPGVAIYGAGLLAVIRRKALGAVLGLTVLFLLAYSEVIDSPTKDYCPKIWSKAAL